MTLRRPLQIVNGQTQQLQDHDGLDLGTVSADTGVAAPLIKANINDSSHPLWIGGLYTPEGSVDTYVVFGGELYGGNAVNGEFDTRFGGNWLRSASTTLTFGTVDSRGVSIPGFSVSGSRVSSLLPLNVPTGSAAVPSLCFAGVPNTGIFRPATNSVGIAGGGASLAHFTPTAASVYTPLGAQTGTNSRPSFYHTDDPNTGLNFPANGTIALVVGGVEAFRVTSTGITFNLPTNISGGGGSVTTPLLIGDGTVSAPAYSFTSDPNTGLYRPSSDVLGITVGGTSVVTIDGTGLATFIGQVKAAADPPSSFAGRDYLVPRKYIESRGMNLLTNGSGGMKSNYNFSYATFDQVETHGGYGSFKTSGGSATRTNDELIPVDPTRKYRLSLWAKSGNADGTGYAPTNRQYIGIIEYDIDGFPIYSPNVNKYSGSTDTTLAAPLNTGDTAITLTDATGWCSVAGSYYRQMAWYPYTNACGYTYPDYTYTRNYAWGGSSAGLWDPGAISGNVITLRTAWTGPNLPAGTKVRNCWGSASYKYIAASNVSAPNTWTQYSGIIGGPQADTTTDSYSYFRYATAYVRFLHLVNYNGVDNTIRISDIWFGEIPTTVYGDNGTATAPSHTFWSDTNTGMYLNSADALGFTCGGTERLYVGASYIVPRVKVANIDGTAASPAYTFLSDLDTGIYRHTTDGLSVACGGAQALSVSSTYVTSYVPLSGKAGTAAAPGYTFYSDADTGLYHPADDKVAITTGGKTRAVFSSDGLQIPDPLAAPDMGGLATLWSDDSKLRNTDKNGVVWGFDTPTNHHYPRRLTLCHPKAAESGVQGYYVHGYKDSPSTTGHYVWQYGNSGTLTPSTRQVSDPNGQFYDMATNGYCWAYLPLLASWGNEPDFCVRLLITSDWAPHANVWLGLVNQSGTPWLNNRIPVAHMAAFRYWTGTDSPNQWSLYTNNNVGPATVLQTTESILAQNVYRIRWTPSGVKYYINDRLIATVSTTMPANNAGVAVFLYAGTNDGYYNVWTHWGPMSISYF
jgi:hypothetical protein